MPRPLRTAALSAIAFLVALMCLLIVVVGPGGSADAAAHADRVGAVPALPRGARSVGRLAAGTPLSIDVALAVRDPAALERYARAVATPTSDDYHHYLTIAQLRRRFAPTPAQIATVRSTLKQAGLTPGALSANGLLLHVTASATRLSAAFHTTLERVQLTDGRRGYVNTQAPEVAAGISGLVRGVVGLSNLVAPHTLGLLRPRGVGHAEADAGRAPRLVSAGAASPCAPASQAASQDGAYTADEIASAYGFSALYADADLGAGQTVGLMEFEKYASSDVQHYESCYGINSGSTSDVTTTMVDGGVGSGYSGGASGSGEAALDIEQILGLAPAASVNVYEAPDTDTGMLDAFTAMLDNSSVKVVSTSWGDCEYVEDQYDPNAAEAESTIFAELAAAGKSVYAAAGDAGSTDCYGESQSGSHGSLLEVDDPGSQPNVTSVGGTTLPADNNTAGQTVWNESSLRNGAGGGGVSLNWTMPSYQSGASSALGVISPGSSTSSCGQTTGTYCREVPDVSADADPQTGYVIYFKGAWQAFGGTSAAAPLWAALTAIANASTYCTTAAISIGTANPVLYAVADSNYAAAFTDVTSGNNDYTPSGYGGGAYAAKAGYDMTTGLGTPNAATLVPDMCAQAAGAGSSSSTAGGSVYTGPGSHYWSAGGGSPNSGVGTTTTTPVLTVTTTTSTTPAATATTAPQTPVSNPPPTATPSPTQPTTGTSTVTQETCRAAQLILRKATDVMALSPRHTSAKLSLALSLPIGCVAEALSLRRHITTTERHGARVLDTLRIQLLNRSGKLLTTLSTLSNRNAASGDQTLELNLARYSGQKLTLRLLATRTGPKTTTFTLRSVALNLS